jgi:hypothetical protein
MKIRFIRAWRVYCVGDVVDLPEGMANELINTGRAARDQQQLLETAAVDASELRTADATPRRRKK